MFNELFPEGLSGGLGMVLAIGSFLVTFAIGIALAVWFIKSRKSLPPSDPYAVDEEPQARRSSDQLAQGKPDPLTEGAKTLPEPQSVLSRGAATSQKAYEQPATSQKPALAPAAPAPTKLPDALSKTRASLFGRIQSLFGSKATLTESEREDLEEVLYTADLGPKTVQDLLDHVYAKLKATGETGFEAVRRELHAKMGEILLSQQAAVDIVQKRAVDAGVDFSEDGLDRLNIFSAKPAVLMVVGVNGAGKTTTIGKLSDKLASRGKRVLVAAGDTFRAAAGEQLKTWTDRAGANTATGGNVEIFDPENVTEPSAVAYQALELAKSKGFDIVIIDTAGRLHTQKNLMEELKKMKRVLAKIDATAPHETLLVLDSNSGQNALIQAKEFHGALTVDGVVLTKLDGSAKGGVAVGITNEVGIPIKLIGVGEKIGDLRPFEPQGFVDSILG